MQKAAATGKISFLQNSHNNKKCSLKIFLRKFIFVKINFFKVVNVDFK